MTQKPKNPKKFPVSCRIYSIKRRAVYSIFSVSDAVFIQGRRLICFEITFLKSLTTVAVNRF